MEAAAAQHTAPASKKRPLDDISHLQNSTYYKMRAFVRDLRPHFIEVLRTPDFKNCEAAHIICEQMKLLMDLYKEMTAETISLQKCKNVPEDYLTEDGQKTQVVKPMEKPHEDRPHPTKLSEKQQTEASAFGLNYIVGGSAFGWNFITFPGEKAAYYGRTKESFRSVTGNPQ